MAQHGMGSFPLMRKCQVLLNAGSEVCQYIQDLAALVA